MEVVDLDYIPMGAREVPTGLSAHLHTVLGTQAGAGTVRR